MNNEGRNMNNEGRNMNNEGRNMNNEGWYYLHQNGSLIYKNDPDACADIRESDFALALWPLNTAERACCWRILVEALAAGAEPVHVKQLAEHWNCDDEDAGRYASYLGARLFRDGDNWCATRADFVDIMSSPYGFGLTALDAFAALAKALGYKPATLCGLEFSSLVKVKDGQ